MNIDLGVTPKGLKRGVSVKKWCQALGFKDAVGLADTCGRIELNATSPNDCRFLKVLADAFTGRGKVAVFDEAGKQVATWEDPKTDEDSQ